MFKNKKGFTLIELLVVIAIIGLLSTLAVVALTSARQKARDSKRVADMKQLQTAMEMVASDKGNYAGVTGCALNANVNTCAGDLTTYFAGVTNLKDPSQGATANPCVTTGGNCALPTGKTTCDYTVAVAPGDSYKFCFALEKATGDLAAGAHEVTPAGIK